MEVIRKKSPGKADSAGILNNSAKPIQKIIAIYTVLKNLGTFDSSTDNVM
jgi:hypothetical protein